MTILLGDLAQKFVDHKVVRSKAELLNAFSTFLLIKKKTIATHFVNIDDVMDVLAKSTIIDMDKLNELVDVENKLSQETLLMHERRKLLLEYVVEERIGRAVDMDMVLGNAISNGEGDTQQNPLYPTTGSLLSGDRRSMKSIAEDHRKQIDAANQFVEKVESDLHSAHSEGDNCLSQKFSNEQDAENEERNRVLQPLEQIFDADILKLAVGARKILYEDTLDDRNFNCMLSPTRSPPSASARRKSSLLSTMDCSLSSRANSRPSTSPKAPSDSPIPPLNRHLSMFPSFSTPMVAMQSCRPHSTPTEQVVSLDLNNSGSANCSDGPISLSRSPINSRSRNYNHNKKQRGGMQRGKCKSPTSPACMRSLFHH